MKCLNLTDIQFDLSKNQFDHFIRVDHLYIGSKVDNLEQIEFLKSIGIKNVIDLKSIEETSFNDRDEFQKAGISYFNLPITNIAELEFEKLQRFGNLISQDGGKTLVYCMSGNRVGAVLALNACFVCGHPKKRALAFGEKVGMKNPNTKTSVSELLEKGRMK
jgi:protein tyrosine phosphatase (PTP) superfamily phosphohydrolase (DUF442 family)